jgi:hypothetical protein
MTADQSTGNEASREEFDNFFGTRQEKKAPKIPQHELDQLFAKIRKIDRYPMESTKTRNVLIVGRTRSGKSTAVGVLKDPCYIPKNMRYYCFYLAYLLKAFSLIPWMLNSKVSHWQTDLTKPSTALTL